MKYSILALALTLISSSLNAQWGDNYIKLSSDITTEEKDISDFDRIHVSEDFKVFVKFSESEEGVRIEANKNLHDLIQVEKNGNQLKIFTKPYSTSYGLGKKSGAKERLVAYITMKNVTEIVGVEDVIFKLENKLKTDHLKIRMKEDCTLEGNIEVISLSADLDEDSVLDIFGSARSLELKANEDSVIKGFDFIVEDAKMNLKEDSEAKLTVNGNIALRAKEDSYFHYKGEGKFVRKILTGDSEVRTF